MAISTIRFLQSKVTISRVVTIPATATTNRASNVCEPSVAQLGSEILATGNWYTGISSDDGNNWQDLDPYSFFTPVNGGFCCDQTTVSDSSRNLMIWLLQYSIDNQENTLRVAVNRFGSISTSNWDLYDFTPTQIDPAWSKEWFDYNHVTISNNYAYVISNMFDFNDNFTRCVVIRLALDELQNDTLNTFDLFVAPSSHFSLRATEGATDEMYFFSHKSTSVITVFQWPESQAQPIAFDVDISQWNRGTLHSPTPDGSNWLRRGDGRITAGWKSGNLIGALWNSNAKGQMPHPHIRAVVIDTTTQARVAEPDLWNPNFAFGFPSAGVNANAEVGLTFFMAEETFLSTMR